MSWVTAVDSRRVTVFQWRSMNTKAMTDCRITIGTMMILTWLVARSGPQALAGYGIGTRLEFLLVPLAFSFGAASVPLIGMAIGAGQVARARQVGWTAAGMAGRLSGCLDADTLCRAVDLNCFSVN